MGRRLLTLPSALLGGSGSCPHTRHQSMRTAGICATHPRRTPLTQSSLPVGRTASRGGGTAADRWHPGCCRPVQTCRGSGRATGNLVSGNLVSGFWRDQWRRPQWRSGQPLTRAGVQVAGNAAVARLRKSSGAGLQRASVSPSAVQHELAPGAHLMDPAVTYETCTPNGCSSSRSESVSPSSAALLAE